ncbi:uncharacterized protein [Spinacia oleracea]|uniref:Reverse transcriptase domain-containing protein n=1 Tax=Spinacia oleracea TaxID=3562 RepID=A0ABM3QPK1_SPIOL|nr:uncharacterized protein LOC130461293 [Spinacia oleracea]
MSRKKELTNPLIVVVKIYKDISKLYQSNPKCTNYSVADIKAYNDMSATQNAMHLNPSDLCNRKVVLSHVVQLGPLINDHHRGILNATYTADEVKKAFFSIPGVKAPGPYGFGAYFFKDSWSIVGDEMIYAILDVLQQGKLLKELNHTVITLIPKTKCPNNVSDFRPISCCNTLYKCVTKILCGRLSQILPDLIMGNQGGFVHGRHIVHNIMVVQDLVKHYGRKDVKSSCLVKIDLQKAYDTVDWNFLQEMLEQLGFPENFVHIVMECESLLLYLMLQAFKLFSDTSGLHANKKKSSIYCYGMAETDVKIVELVSGFTRSQLPFKYLGVPICSKKITTAQCDRLVDKMVARKKIWSSRNLSYTTRMQLINSVLLIFHMYWAKIYVLPKKVLHDINKICREFLWSGKAYITKPSNISWENSCCNKKEGGLGSRDVIKGNTAVMGKCVWVVASKQDNVYIKWVNVVYIKDGVWWDYQPSASASWYWRKVCEIKESLKHYYSHDEFSAISQYSVKAVYEKIVGARPLVNWDRLVWNGLNILRHRFICWMAVQSRLQTTTKLAKIGIIRGIGYNRQSQFRKQVWYAGLAAAVYVVWQCRNGSFWDKSVPTVQHFVNSIKQIVKDRIKVVMPKKWRSHDLSDDVSPLSPECTRHIHALKLVGWTI